MPTKKKSSASNSPKATKKPQKKATKKAEAESYDSSSITVLKGLEKGQECILEIPMMERVYTIWFTRL